MPNTPEKSSVCLFEPSPRRDIVLPNIDIVPVVQLVNRCVVQLYIENRSSIILHGIFRSSHDDDDDQRNSVEAGIDSTEDGKALMRPHMVIYLQPVKDEEGRRKKTYD